MNSCDTLRLLAKCGSMDLSMLAPIADEMERLRVALEWVKRHADGLSATWHVADRALQTVHKSDCALHNAPALPVGPCDCAPSHEPCEQPRNWAIWQCMRHQRLFAAHAGCSRCANDPDTSSGSQKSGEQP
jgi:hypothetical protein